MNLLSKVSFLKIHCLATKIKIVSTLNVLGIISDKKAEEMNKKRCIYSY